MPDTGRKNYGLSIEGETGKTGAITWKDWIAYYLAQAAEADPEIPSDREYFRKKVLLCMALHLYSLKSTPHEAKQ